MNSLPSFLASTFNLSGMIAFCAGIVSCRVYYWIKDVWADHARPSEPRHQHKWKSIIMAWSIMLAGMLYIVGQTHESSVMIANTTNNLRNLTLQTKNCQLSIIKTLQLRADLTEQADDMTEQLRTLLVQSNNNLNTWINELLNPPSGIAALPIGDLKRQQYGMDITAAYFTQSQDLQKQVADLQRLIRSNHDERSKHPVDSPQC